MRKPIIGVTVGTPIKPTTVVEKAKDVIEQAIKDALEQAGGGGTGGSDGSGSSGGTAPTIEISDDGYWVINGVPTKHKAKGEDGDDYVLTEEDKKYIASLVTPSGGGGSDHTPDGETLITDGGKTSVHGIYPKLIDSNDPTITKDTTINNTPIGFFVGTQEAYDNLKPEEQANLFALIQDEDDAIAFEDLKKASYTKGLKYELSSDGLSYHCVGIGEADSRFIAIPPYHKGKPVTEIAEEAFREEEIRSVVIPDTVTKIGSYAFWGCPQLTSVNFGKGITRIGSGAFYDCIVLDNVNIPKGCTNIDSSAFCGCTSLKRVFIPSTVSIVGANAFLYCSNVTIYIEMGVLSTLWSDQWNPDNCIVLRNVTAPNAQSVIHAIAADRADHAKLIGDTAIVCEIDTSVDDSYNMRINLPKDIEMGIYVAEARIYTGEAPNVKEQISAAILPINEWFTSCISFACEDMVLVLKSYRSDMSRYLKYSHRSGEATSFRIDYFDLRRII